MEVNDWPRFISMEPGKPRRAPLALNVTCNWRYGGYTCCD
jgi:hypothetical protein